MSDNGDRKDERTIKACFMPSCNGKCIARQHNNVGAPIYWVECDRCDYQTAEFDNDTAVTAHNELCALVKKGRKYDVAQAGKVRLNKERKKFYQERDEAVGLLGAWLEATCAGEDETAYIHGLTIIGRETEKLLARIDKGGGK